MQQRTIRCWRRFKLTEFDFSVETGFRYLFTDYSDDVSKHYVDLGVFGGMISQAMSYRSNEIHTNFRLHRPRWTDYSVLADTEARIPIMLGVVKTGDIFMVTTFKITAISVKYDRANSVMLNIEKNSLALSIIFPETPALLAQHAEVALDLEPLTIRGSRTEL